MHITGLMLGGALGTLCRYLVTLAAQPLASSASFPVGTITVNILGCFLIGLLSNLRLTGHIPPAWYLALGTGFTGAFTTFSTFELEADALTQEGAWSLATAYVLASLVLGYAALLLGRFAASHISADGL
jgi:CrcB protein